MKEYRQNYMSAVSVKHISHHFSRNATQIPVIQDVSIGIPSGQFLAIIGPSGCGKTTLLNIINQLIQPSEGENISSGKNMSRVFQSPTLFPWLTLRENIDLPLFLGRNPSIKITKGRGELLIEKFGLGGFEEKYPKELSGGMQSRVALARALITQPELLLLDEPFAALDEITALKIMLNLVEFLKNMRPRPTVIFVTHTLSQAVLLADRVIVLSQRPARIIADKTIVTKQSRTKSFFMSRDFQRIETMLRTVISNEFL